MKWSKLQEWAEIDALPLAIELAEDPPKPAVLLLTCENRLRDWFNSDEDSKLWEDFTVKEQDIFTAVLAWKLCEKICQGYAALGRGWNTTYMTELRRLYQEENA